MNKTRNILIATSLAVGLSGCASTPINHFSGTRPQTALKQKNVAIITDVADGQF